MLKSFFHTGFVVKDIEKSVQFYADVLGMRKGMSIMKAIAYLHNYSFVDSGNRGVRSCSSGVRTGLWVG